MLKRTFMPQVLGVALLAGCWAPGCMLQKQDDADEFREAVPLREAVQVAGPETDSDATSSTASAPNALHPLATTRPLGRGQYAKWYGFTRAVRAGVNAVTGVVLGSAWYIVHTEPTSVKDGEAIWGPYTDALEPASYRFRVTRVAEAEYDYVLEGRPKQSTSDSAYRIVLKGHGFGKRHEQHGEGEFTIDLDVARELDPPAHQNDSGTVHIVHHLPHDIGEGHALPRSIMAEVTPDPAINPESFSVTSNAHEDGTGQLLVDATADVDDTKTTQLEDISIQSRWRADGAGRADIVIAGGDVPADPGSVTAVECWGADFMRAYYSDSISFAPTEGDASACVYDAP
ncbi:MAG TPA: hypothetical protein VHB79_11205 [Polyangiaceae bacterium]|nr:hypothetical protein [Polyangiaceae bacterium]